MANAAAKSNYTVADKDKAHAQKQLADGQLQPYIRRQASQLVADAR
jgi:hypothetical protein